jgi:Uma2 family endonuclease
MAGRQPNISNERLLTGEEVVRMEDIGPCELVEGRIVPVSMAGDAHGGCVCNFASELHAFTGPKGLGKVRAGDVGVYTRRDPDTVRAADVLFISNERYAKRTRELSVLDVAPELVVEVRSADQAWAKVRRKLVEYFAIGVRLVWVADLPTRTIRAYRSPSDYRVLAEGEDLSGEDVLPGFSVPVAHFFD